MYELASRVTLWLSLRPGVPGRRARGDEEGQGLVEYALILILMAMVVIAGLSIVGTLTKNVYSNISNGLSV